MVDGVLRTHLLGCSEEDAFGDSFRTNPGRFHISYFQDLIPRDLKGKGVEFELHCFSDQVDVFWWGARYQHP